MLLDFRLLFCAVPWFSFRGFAWFFRFTIILFFFVCDRQSLFLLLAVPSSKSDTTTSQIVKIVHDGFQKHLAGATARASRQICCAFTAALLFCVVDAIPSAQSQKRFDFGSFRFCVFVFLLFFLFLILHVFLCRCVNTSPRPSLLQSLQYSC